jgi:SAM-dependent methyltransferase
MLAPEPPGTVLQMLYVRERLAAVPPGDFIEVGTGTGRLARVLLAAGWSGIGYELGEGAARLARQRTIGYPFEVRVADWLAAPPDEPADLIASCMVIEHLPDEQEAQYFHRARRTLRPGGRVVLIVPASPRFWGIEDEIAGHQRRYTRGSLQARLAELGWSLNHVAGLTFPLSNLLLPISNRLVARAERDRLALSEQARTVMSGHRDVRGKTTFHPAARLVLNQTTLYPLHLVQKAFARSERAMVLYAEATPR